jgi:alpha-1,6-mannosyltransferase
VIGSLIEFHALHSLAILSPSLSITSVILAMPFPTWPFFALIPTFILIHLFVSPYTKVEESFNIQAIHDILVHGIPTENADQFLTANYDHVSFPGSVPRTFSGALVLSGLSRPFLWMVGRMEQVQLLGM